MMLEVEGEKSSSVVSFLTIALWVEGGSLGDGGKLTSVWWNNLLLI